MRKHEWATRQKAAAQLLALWPELAGLDPRKAEELARRIQTERGLAGHDGKDAPRSVPLPEMDPRRDPPRALTAERFVNAVRQAGRLVANPPADLPTRCPVVEAGPLVPWEPTVASIQTVAHGSAALSRAANSWARRRRRNR